MHFCPDCHNLLVMKKELDKYAYCCNTCPYSYTLHSALKHETNYILSTKEEIYNDQENLKNLDFCNKNCECGATRVAFTQLQTRSADEPMTIFYNCIECKTIWRE